MKKLLFIFTLFMSLYSFAQSEIVNPTNPPKLVNDFTGKFITPGQRQALEDKLVAYDDSTSNQIAMVIIDDLKGYSIADYAIALGRKWGVGGQKKFSNGVVILVNTGEKGGQRGVFVATGYGLEGAVTDLVAGEIVQNNLIPNFKAGNNYLGLNEATDNIIKAAEGRYKAPEDYHSGGGGFSVLGMIIVFIIVIVLLALIFGKGNGGDGGYVSRRGYTDNWPRQRGYTPWIFPGGGGGGSGWSGGSGGGFGGFGGGSFGGGGAGGSW